jgi:GNAT superfamily N-acetyltransferase
MDLAVSPLLPQDRASWEVLARGYKAFYKTETSPAEYEATWNRLLRQDDVFGIGGKLDGKLVGIAHYLFHTSAWAAKICYLQDLFVAPEVRGKGIARALIQAVAAAARQAKATRYYWLTQDHNAVARALYDKVAKHNGFIRYDFPL